MTDPLKKFTEQANQTRLSAKEKEQMLTAVIGSDKAQPSGISHLIHQLLQSKVAMPVSVALLLILIATPLTYAAQNSRPGGWLYGVEIMIIEPAEELLTSPWQEQNEFATERLHERLNELQNSSPEQLDSETLSYISENIEDYALEVVLNESEQSPSLQIDQLVEVAAILDAQDELFSEAGTESQDIALAEQTIDIEIENELDMFIESANETEQKQLVESEINDVVELSKDTELTQEEELLLEQAIDEMDGADYDEALQKILDAKISILAEQYSEEYE